MKSQIYIDEDYFLQMNNDNIFISTQIQGQLDDWELENSKNESILSRMGTLKSQYLQLPSTSTEVPQKKAIRRKPKTSKPKKVKSITSHVTDCHKDKQRSILQVLSGKKRKVKDIIKRIADIEKQTLPTLDKEDLVSKGSVVYTEEEWFDIVRNINIHLPHLSRSSKLTLSLITRKYLQFENYDRSDTPYIILKDSGPDDVEVSSLWKMAGTPPVGKLTDEELKWLYDISDCEEGPQVQNGNSSFFDMGTENVLNLSQVLKRQLISSPEDRLGLSDVEILNSSPEPEYLSFKRSTDYVPLAPKTKIKARKVLDPLNSVSTGISAVEEISSDDDLPSLIKQRPIFGAGDSQLNPASISSDESLDTDVKILSPINESITKIHSANATGESPTILPSIEIRIDSTNSPNEELNEQFVEDCQNDLIVSPPLNHSNLDSHVNRKENEFNLYTNFEFDDSEGPREVDSIDQLPNDIFPVEEFQSPSSFRNMFSTAQSDIYYTQVLETTTSTFNTRDNETRTIQLSPVEIEIKGLLNQSELHRVFVKNSRFLMPPSNEYKSQSDNNAELSMVTTRILGARKNIIEVDEIPNSSSDEGDVSVIEIVREIKHDNKIMIEVPSSQQQISTSQDISSEVEQTPQASSKERVPDVLQSQDSLKNDSQLVDYSKLSTEELKNQLNNWGLKIGKGRSKMIETLNRANLLISQSQTSLLQSGSQAQDFLLGSQVNQGSAKSYIFETLTVLIKKNKVLYDKIILFEPIQMSEIQRCFKEVDIDIESYLIREYCDAKGVTLVGADKEVDWEQLLENESQTT